VEEARELSQSNEIIDEQESSESFERLDSADPAVPAVESPKWRTC
jgi:hypothetical protein